MQKNPKKRRFKGQVFYCRTVGGFVTAESEPSEGGVLDISAAHISCPGQVQRWCMRSDLRPLTKAEKGE